MHFYSGALMYFLCGVDSESDPLTLKRLLVPAPDDLLMVQPASPLVNSVKNEGPDFWRTCRYLANRQE